MIVFDLRCSGGHVFEVWFGSSGDYDDQQRRGLVSCPICGDGEVDKAVMAPRLSVESTPERDDPARAKAMLAGLARIQSKLLEGSEHVGRDFAHRARAMHEGTEDQRRIHGQVSPDEARALVDEGVPVAPLPLPVRPLATDH